MIWGRLLLSSVCYLAALLFSAWCLKEALVVAARWLGL